MSNLPIPQDESGLRDLIELLVEQQGQAQTTRTYEQKISPTDYLTPQYRRTLDSMFSPEPWAYDPRFRNRELDGAAAMQRQRDFKGMEAQLGMRQKIDALEGGTFRAQHTQKVPSRTGGLGGGGSRQRYDIRSGPNGELLYVPKDPGYGLPTVPVRGPDREPLLDTQALSASELDALRENAQQIFQATRALKLMRGETVDGETGDPTATGWEGYIPDMMRLIPGVIPMMGGQEGVATRASVGNIGSLRIKQRSGGAVPAQEMGRLRPFVPAEGDPEEVVRTKLVGFVNEYARMLEEDLGHFQTSGRRVPKALETMVKESIKSSRGSLFPGRMEPSQDDYRRRLMQEIQRRRGGQ